IPLTWRNQPDERHDDVVHQRLHDGPECGSDDDADGQVDDIAFEGEFLEFIKERHRSLAGLQLCQGFHGIHGRTSRIVRISSQMAAASSSALSEEITSGIGSNGPIIRTGDLVTTKK